MSYVKKCDKKTEFGDCTGTYASYGGEQYHLRKFHGGSIVVPVKPQVCLFGCEDTHFYSDYGQYQHWKEAHRLKKSDDYYDYLAERRPGFGSVASCEVKRYLENKTVALLICIFRANMM